LPLPMVAATPPAEAPRDRRGRGVRPLVRRAERGDRDGRARAATRAASSGPAAAARRAPHRRGAALGLPDAARLALRPPHVSERVSGRTGSAPRANPSLMGGWRTMLTRGEWLRLSGFGGAVVLLHVLG